MENYKQDIKEKAREEIWRKKMKLGQIKKQQTRKIGATKCMKKAAILFLLSVFVFGGCGTEKIATENNATNSEMNNVDGENATESTGEMDISEKANFFAEADTVEEEIEVVESETELFARLPDEFYFSSGAGGWGTELFLEDDGTFHGLHHDSDMGSTGENYPNGTQYICCFEGKFTAPQQISEYVYSTTIEYMNVEREGEEYIEDGIRYIVSGPYGLENAGEIMLYLYRTPRAELSEGFLSWMQGTDMGPDYLNCFGIYNVNEETAFSGYIYEDYTELRKLNGKYVNDAGDEVIIHLESKIEEYTDELGYVEWKPYGEEAEHGNIMKNPIGGFTIYLDESICYNFEITNYEVGNIEFSGADKWSESLGTFVMQ